MFRWVKSRLFFLAVVLLVAAFMSWKGAYTWRVDFEFPWWGYGAVALLGLLQMVLLTRFLGRYCRRKVLALLLCWHTLYLTYFFSILRQGLALAMLLGLLLPWLERKRFGRYFLGCAACALLHSSALILVLLPLLQLIPWKLEQLLILTGLAWAAGLLLAGGAFRGLLTRVLPGAVVR